MKVRWKEKYICESMKIADSFLSRLKGLMFLKEFVGFDGLLIKQCNSIHMFFMNFAIDAIFLNEELKVIKIYRGIRPWRMTRLLFGATQVLEIPAGNCPEDLQKGDILELCTN